MDSQHAREFEEHGLHAYRIERGAEVLGPDGSLGTVEQIVVDGDTGELQSLVVRGEAGMFMELPASRIESATGEQVYLSIGRADLAAHPDLARPFKPEMYIPVDGGAVVPPGEAIKRDPDAPLLTEMDEDSIEIAAPDAVEDQSTLHLHGRNGAGLDIADQPTIVLGPSDDLAAASQRTSGANPLTPSGEDMNLTAENDQTSALEPLDIEAEVAALDDLSPAPLTATGDEVASVSEVEVLLPPESFISDSALLESDTSPRSAAGDSVTTAPGRDLSAYLTGGILAATAAASIAYLLWSRRQRTGANRLPGLNAARAQVDTMRSATAAAQQALTDQTRARLADLAPRARALSGRGTEAAARARSNASGLLDSVSGRIGDLNTMIGGLAPLGDLARRRTSAAVRSLPSATDLRDTVVAQLPTTSASTMLKRMSAASGTLRNWLDDAIEAVGTWRPDRSRWMRLGMMRQSLRLSLPSPKLRSVGSSAQTVARRLPTQTALRAADEARHTMRRGMKRMSRRVRWFQRGVLAGTIWGILFAPVPGREARTVVTRYLSKVPVLRDYIGGGMRAAPGVGSSGPHPRSDIASSHAPYSGVGMGSPLLGSESEEPLLSSRESDISSLPGGSPAL